MAGRRLFDNGINRPFAYSRIVFRNNAHECTHHQANYHSSKYVHFVEWNRVSTPQHQFSGRQKPVDYKIRSNNGENYRSPIAYVQSFLNVPIFFYPYQSASYDRKNET